ncbi:MAG: peptide MFS transporter [Candidatus Marinimicrobia bacterium]|nr:peptide MFS transporter [Candidatus Neomarinimicrobiota bacterium]
MFKNHPKGLAVAFFANMGERFGFYTMMACLVFFLQARFALAEDQAGNIYSWFYTLIYGLALVGGLIADKTQNYKGTILTGIVVMLVGYIVMAIPGMGLKITIAGLMVIALGNGLFKGNLQALVGQLYDDPKYEKLRDSAFSLFYMGINIGAFFAPSAANGIRNWFLKSQGFIYDADLPGLCNSYIGGSLTDTTNLQMLADKVTGAPVADLGVFAQSYIDAFSTGYNYAFGIAAGAMVISLLIYILFKRQLPDRKKLVGTNKEIIEIPKSEEKQRIVALLLVFFVVIFFWMSFHQNGLTLSYFARDYVAKVVGPITYIFFELKSFLSLIAAIIGLIFVFKKSEKILPRIIGGALFVIGGLLTYFFYSQYAPSNSIEPEIFQQFNPIFIVFGTPIVVWFFGFLRARNIEPSTPKKIGIGMILAAVGFFVILIGSLHLLSPSTLGTAVSPNRISPNWLISTYFTLTIAELFLSPMGISFVSKVAPPRWQGLMQGGWFAATAIGNKLTVVGSSMWVKAELWQLWLTFIVCCLLSAAFLFSIMKRLENATK